MLGNRLHLTNWKGVVSFMVEIGTIVRRGQPLFQICDPVTDKLTIVTSPADGCMWVTCFAQCFFVTSCAGTTGKD